MKHPNKLKLPIRPRSLFNEERVISIKKISIKELRQLKSMTKDSLVFKKALVAYLDILGFSKKRDDGEIDACFTDFPNPIINACQHYPNVRVNSFSDSVVLAADVDHAQELIAMIRSAFQYWTFDGVLVRGGIALGKYTEKESRYFEIAPSFRGYIITGSGVAKAVKIESEKPAALLFTDDECAAFVRKSLGEPIFMCDNKKCVGWSDDLLVLFWFMGVSLVRHLKLLSTHDSQYEDTARKLRNNIQHALQFDGGRYLLRWALAILSAPFVKSLPRKSVCEFLNISESDFMRFKYDIYEKLKSPRMKELEDLADSDSSMPTYQFIKGAWNLDK